MITLFDKSLPNTEEEVLLSVMTDESALFDNLEYIYCKIPDDWEETKLEKHMGEAETDFSKTVVFLMKTLPGKFRHFYEENSLCGLSIRVQFQISNGERTSFTFWKSHKPDLPMFEYIESLK